MLGEVLIEMAQEEVGELLATLKVDGADKGPLELLGDKLASYLTKPQDAPIAKLSATVLTNDDITKAVNAATSELTTRLDAVQKGVTDATQAVETITKAYGELKASHEDLKKRWGKMPTPPKAGLMSVSKSGDGDGELTAPTQVEPVKKTDGSIDEIATAIKKVHASGGRPLGLR